MTPYHLLYLAALARHRWLCLALGLPVHSHDHFVWFYYYGWLLR